MLSLTFNPFPLLTTERLELRKVEATDVNEIFFLRSDKRVMQFIDKKPCESTEEAANFIRNIQKLEADNDAITWAITIKNNPMLIGTVCYWNIQKNNDRAEIGYALHPDHQGKGVMQEVMTKILEYGFDVMKLHSVEAIVNPYNISSIKLLERNNFVREGYFKENWFYNDKYLDSAVYSLLAPQN